MCGAYAEEDGNLRKQVYAMVVEAMGDVHARNLRHKTAYTSVVVGDVDEELLWEIEVQNADVSCRVVDVDRLLDAERPLVADLRYLWLLHVGRTTSLSDIVKMKKQRNRRQHDLERYYYNPALTILRASAKGQLEVVVLFELRTRGDGARGDLWVYVDGHEYPSMMKAINGSLNPGTDAEGIHNNKAAFGKFFKIIRTKLVNEVTGSQSFICTFLNHIECIWFLKFEFEGKDVKRVEVGPQIPAKGVPVFVKICTDLDSILDLGTEDVMLSELLDLSVPLGLKYISRYMDTLCHMKGVSINDVVFKKYNSQCIDMKEARIIACSGKSQILHVKGENAVIKVGPLECIQVEHSSHKLVDGHVQNIRYMVDGASGEVKGVGKLGFIKLQGLGKCISDISWNKIEEYWTKMESALSGLHARKLLHWDVKLENMMLIGEQLVLHDFDVSCRFDAREQLSQYVGTAEYRSSYWKKGEVFVPANDWVSLGLSFASLLKLPKGGNQLDGLLTHPEIPKPRREKLSATMYSATARESG
jgi:hypothetical protein